VSKEYHQYVSGAQGLKKIIFPGKLIKISRRTQVEDDRPFMTSQKEFVFLKLWSIKLG